MVEWFVPSKYCSKFGCNKKVAAHFFLRGNLLFLKSIRSTTQMTKSDQNETIRE